MEIFYDALKNSDEEKLNLISNEIFKMNRNNRDYWEFIIQNSSENLTKKLPKTQPKIWPTYGKHRSHGKPVESCLK